MALDDEKQSQETMLNFMLRQGDFTKTGLRLGQLSLKSRPSIPTPNFVACSSRGIVPHVAQDVASKMTTIPALYIGLEDFIEKTPQRAPIFKQPPGEPSKLRDFISLPKDTISILGPRRNPALECPGQNTNSSIAISTSVGFQSLQFDDYVHAVQNLQADVSLSLADVVSAKPASQKRLEKSVDRTHAWMRDTLTSMEAVSSPLSALFATIPPLEPQEQSFYLSDLSDEYSGQFSGISVSSIETATTLPHALEILPRLCLTNQETPHDLVRAVELGNDLIAVPFVTETSENGIAMAFSFDPDPELRNASTGLDLWATSHATDLGALVEGCQCYTCSRHHRAFLHHLLSAKEMLAWTLLQIHNFHSINEFFRQIRESMIDGTFYDRVKRFSSAYDKQPPQASGKGPRVRGYQTKSVGGGEAKKNAKAYGRLDEHVLKLDEAESGVATPTAETGAEELEKQGMGISQSS